MDEMSGSSRGMTQEMMHDECLNYINGNSLKTNCLISFVFYYSYLTVTQYVEFGFKLTFQQTL